MGLIEVPNEARFSHISDFAIGTKSAQDPLFELPVTADLRFATKE
jgi:hypothetical protein